MLSIEDLMAEVELDMAAEAQAAKSAPPPVQAKHFTWFSSDANEVPRPTDLSLRKSSGRTNYSSPLPTSDSAEVKAALSSVAPSTHILRIEASQSTAPSARSNALIQISSALSLASWNSPVEARASLTTSQTDLQNNPPQSSSTSPPPLPSLVAAVSEPVLSRVVSAFSTSPTLDGEPSGVLPPGNEDVRATAVALLAQIVSIGLSAGNELTPLFTDHMAPVVFPALTEALKNGNEPSEELRVLMVTELGLPLAAVCGHHLPTADTFSRFIRAAAADVSPKVSLPALTTGISLLLACAGDNLHMMAGPVADALSLGPLRNGAPKSRAAAARALTPLIIAALGSSNAGKTGHEEEEAGVNVPDPVRAVTQVVASDPGSSTRAAAVITCGALCTAMASYDPSSSTLPLSAKECTDVVAATLVPVMAGASNPGLDAVITSAAKSMTVAPSVLSQFMEPGLIHASKLLASSWSTTGSTHAAYALVGLLSSAPEDAPLSQDGVDAVVEALAGATSSPPVVAAKAALVARAGLSAVLSLSIAQAEPLEWLQAAPRQPEHAEALVSLLGAPVHSESPEARGAIALSIVGSQAPVEDEALAQAVAVALLGDPRESTQDERVAGIVSLGSAAWTKSWNETVLNAESPNPSGAALLVSAASELEVVAEVSQTIRDLLHVASSAGEKLLSKKKKRGNKSDEAEAVREATRAWVPAVAGSLKLMGHLDPANLDAIVTSPALLVPASWAPMRIAANRELALSALLACLPPSHSLPLDDKLWRVIGDAVSEETSDSIRLIGLDLAARWAKPEQVVELILEALETGTPPVRKRAATMLSDPKLAPALTSEQLDTLFVHADDLDVPAVREAVLSSLAVVAANRSDSLLAVSASKAAENSRDKAALAQFL